MKLLILGAGGFIGSRFYELFQSDHEIIRVGGRSNTNQGDLTNYDRVQSLIDDSRPGAILNLCDGVGREKVKAGVQGHLPDSLCRTYYASFGVDCPLENARFSR